MKPVKPVSEEEGRKEERRMVVRSALEEKGPKMALAHWREWQNEERFGYLVNAVMLATGLPNEVWKAEYPKYAPLVKEEVNK